MTDNELLLFSPKLKRIIAILCSVSLFFSPLSYAAANPTAKNVNNSSGSSGSANSNNQNSQNSPNNSSNPNNPNSTNNPPPQTSGSNTGSNSAMGNDKVVLNFENADIQSVIKAISQLSGKNFVIDPRVKGTVNIVSDQPIAKADSYKVLESALRMQGFATVEADGVIKVLPETEAKTYGMRTEAGLDDGKSVKHQEGDQVITKVFVIQHGSAMQLSNSLRPLIAPNNSIAVYPNSNALIITDYSSNIARISKIINQLSVVSSGKATKPVIVTLQNAVAADVAQILQSYLSGGGSASSGGGSAAAAGNADGPGVTITVDASTNSVILYSVIPDKLDELKELALKVDKNIGSVNNNLHVVYLKNADANHVADVLRSVVNAQENPDLTATSSQSRFAAEPTSTFGSTGSSGSGGGGGMSSAGGSASSKATSTGNNRGSAANNGNQKDAPKILVQAEPTTNSLIIQAPQAVYKNLRMIIDMVDVRRAQVMIEAMLADISTTQSGTFGIQWLVGGGTNQVGALGLSNYAQGGSSLSSLTSSVVAATAAASGGGATSAISIPNEVYVGLVTGTTSVGGQTIPSLSALADMLAATSVGNILSRPTLITLDNEEARIMVGSNIGIPNGQYQNTAAQAGNLVTTITRQDLGQVLQIKPLITQNGTIQLEIYQEDSLIAPNQPANTAQNGPSFLKRNMRATILVDDGQIIALGGMTEDAVSISENGIPGLSAIPYLGWLFSWQTRSHTKSNLVLFLRPVIIKNADGYKALANQRYNYIVGQETQMQARGNWVLPDIKPVTLDNQLPYLTTQPLPGQSNPSLNLNKNLPVVDLTASGANVDKSDPKALSVSVEKISPNVVNTNVVNKANNNIEVPATATTGTVSPTITGGAAGGGAEETTTQTPTTAPAATQINSLLPSD
ncbi:MAG: ral secretion pathway protein [Pseudomonadota bacterium]|nr:ral secretion pathway protein [Pseudomonadota bacterium]